MQPRTDGVLGMIERLATAQGFDPSNLEKLIDLHERTEATRAKKAYYAAFADMQQDLPSVFRSGRNKHNDTTFAKNHDVQTALRPVLFKFGFGISFRTSDADGKLRVSLVLGHREGHSEESTLVVAYDTTGSKNAIQAMGSSQTYAQRYLTFAMLNITSHDDADDDGRSSEQAKVASPTGYDSWSDDMDAVADRGLSELSAAWASSAADLKRFAAKHHPAQHEARKRKAALADKARKDAAQ